MEGTISMATTFASELEGERCLYVAPYGNDNNVGTLNHPFKSLEKARDYVRSIRNNTKGNITVFFRGGTYNFAKPVEFNGKDSGPNTVYFKAYTGEKPVFSAGRTVKNWEHHQGNIFRTYVGEETEMMQFYLNDQKQTLARYPNLDEGEEGMLRLPRSDKGFAPCPKGLFDADSARGVRVVARKTWRIYLHTASGLIKDTDCDFLVISENQQANTWVFKDTLSDLMAYFENSYEFMDTPGEWYKGNDGYLYFYAKDNETVESLNDQNAIIPVSESIIKFTGDEVNRAENIVFDGIAFRHTGWTWSLHNSIVTNQANLFLDATRPQDSTYRLGRSKKRTPGIIDGEGVRNLTIRNCIINLSGGSGIFLRRFINDVNIVGNIIRDNSGGGIEISDDFYKADNGWFPENIRIANNYISDCNNQWHAGCGIAALFASNVTVEHNHLVNLPYTGISVGWGWDTFTPEMNRNWTVRNNRLENCMNLLHDGGYIYAPNPAYGTNIFENNFIKGAKKQLDPSTNIMGIYHDSMPANWVDKTNVVEGLQIPVFFGNGSHTSKGVWANFDVQGKYKNRPEIIIENYNVFEEPFWDEKPKNIINNSGLQSAYKHLSGENPDFSADTEVSFYTTKIGAVKRFNVRLTNNTEKDVDTIVSFPDGKDNHYEMDKYNESVTVPAKSEVLIPFKIRYDDKAFAAPHFVRATAKTEDCNYDITLAVIVEKSGNHVISVQDEGYVETSGVWNFSAIGGYNGISKWSGDGTATFKTRVSAGKYKLSFYNPVHEFNTDKLLLEITAKDKTHEIYINQKVGDSGWVELGTFEFDAGEANIKCSAVGMPRLSAVSFESVDPILMEQFTANSLEEDLTETLIISMNGKMLKDGKEFYKMESLLFDGMLYVSLRDFSNYFDSRLDWKNEEYILGITKGAMYIEANAIDNTIVKNNVSYTPVAPIRMKGDRMFISLNDAVKLFEMSMSDNKEHFIITTPHKAKTINIEKLFTILPNVFHNGKEVE